MALTEQDITRLAQLASLQMDRASLAQAQTDFTRILGLIETLQSVDTTGIEPMAHPLEARQSVTLRLQKDIPEPPHTQAALDACLRNAPAAHDGLFLVPTVIE
ncbi:Asp-tRNA(Asn)/Glu-tRNA(Gln) amidotransferase subunit GatC [Castellaniella sp.]|uniref:Asp-tRNA(Asn)/Glu-tRNA(Gln) amidotransferase subunit GatC n=1 Tax=Castellaniella sp. TaxID=1955812 RepID=UPI00355D2502